MAVYAYINRKNRKLCLRPADPEGEDELREILKDLRSEGLDVIDIETEMPEKDYNEYQRQRYGYNTQSQGSNSFGFAPQSRYYPMPPDFNPQMHHVIPIIYPTWLEVGDGGGYRGGRGGYRGVGDNITRMGEYDGSGRENPRDTGGRDRNR